MSFLARIGIALALLLTGVGATGCSTVAVVSDNS
jgi:hypothetical protein